MRNLGIHIGSLVFLGFSTFGGEKKCIQIFGWKTPWKTAVWGDGSVALQWILDCERGGGWMVIVHW